MNTTTNNQAIETATTGSEIETGTQYSTSEVTTMTTETNTEIQATETTTTKPAKAKKAPMNYPFVTKAQLAGFIANDDGFVVAALSQLHDWQTAHEQATKSTEVKNRRGFMSSHAVNGSKLAEKVKSGAKLDGEEMDKARSIVSRYTRQLAEFGREQALASNPELAATAAVFGV